MIPPRIADSARGLGLVSGWPVKIMMDGDGNFLLRAFSTAVTQAAIDPQVFLAETEAAPHLDLLVTAEEIAAGGAP